MFVRARCPDNDERWRREEEKKIAKAKAKAKTQKSGKNLLGDLFKLNQKKKDGFKIPLY